MLHSNTARFNGEDAARTSRTARVSSTVSMTMMGVEESIRTFRRSRTSAMRMSETAHTYVKSLGPVGEDVSSQTEGMNQHGKRLGEVLRLRQKNAGQLF